MKKTLATIVAGVTFAVGAFGTAFFQPQQLQASAMAASFFDISVKDIDGKEMKLSALKGKTILVVNVASKCGYTPQYEGLEALYKKYKDKGFVVLGVPSNDFGAQEPGTESQIKEFCSTNFGVTFPMLSKATVKGSGKSPLYKFLTEKETNPQFAGEIAWNFSKFLISKNGEILARFESSDTPMGEKITKAVEAALSKK